jgi:hypothetical protein
MMTTGLIKPTHVVRYRLRPVLLCALAIYMVCGPELISQAWASDRDTPAYMIYVDPVTGKYTTKPPADNSTTINTMTGQAPASASGNADMGGMGVTADNSGLATNMSDRRRMKAPTIAILLLTGMAVFSLLFRNYRSS